MERLLGPASARTRELVAKEIRVFFRDSTQWSQLILLAVLEAWPVYLMTSRLRGDAELTTVLLALGLAGAALLTAAAMLVPLEVGVRHVEKLEL